MLCDKYQTFICHTNIINLICLLHLEILLFHYIMTDTDKFKKIMKKFFKQLRLWAKNENNKEQLQSLDSQETKIDIGMNIDCRGSIRLFLNNIYPYASQILEGNDEYFLSNNIEIDSEFHKLQDQLREWWPNLREDRKEYVRKHVKLLVMLGAISIKHEAIRAIINLHRDPDNPLIF